MDRKLTQHKMIIDYLSNHNSLTTLEACKKLGITKLPTRIGELKSKGYVFKKTRARSSKGARFIIYSLIEK